MRCAHKRCRQDATVIYINEPLCEKHWLSKQADQETAEEAKQQR